MTSVNPIYQGKSALFDLLVAALASDTATVFWGRPNHDHDIHDNVYVTDGSSDENFAQMANRRPTSMDHDVELTVEIDVLREGTDARTTEERLWELVDLVHLAVTTDQNLSETAWKARIASTEQTNPAYEGVRVASAVIRIEASVRTRSY